MEAGVCSSSAVAAAVLLSTDPKQHKMIIGALSFAGFVSCLALTRKPDPIQSLTKQIHSLDGNLNVIRATLEGKRPGLHDYFLSYFYFSVFHLNRCGGFFALVPSGSEGQAGSVDQRWWLQDRYSAQGQSFHKPRWEANLCPPISQPFHFTSFPLQRDSNTRAPLLVWYTFSLESMSNNSGSIILC